LDHHKALKHNSLDATYHVTIFRTERTGLFLNRATVVTLIRVPTKKEIGCAGSVSSDIEAEPISLAVDSLNSKLWIVRSLFVTLVISKGVMS